ncbi:Hypothetical predicted protein [Pelobates cultripes]|uniref:Uncharacterized protein n=1 Tax=Pelobates cultripes TaxID=61616 RepID=A0AAD1RL45_PELCU|nr:Hypothetical predicted protein [Pelobates cultripes]
MSGYNQTERGDLKLRQYTPKKAGNGDWTTITYNKRRNPYRPQGSQGDTTPRVKHHNHSWRPRNRFETLRTEEANNIAEKENRKETQQSSNDFLGPRSQYFNRYQPEPPKPSTRKRPLLEDAGGGRDIVGEKKMRK